MITGPKRKPKTKRGAEKQRRASLFCDIDADLHRELNAVVEFFSDMGDGPGRRAICERGIRNELDRLRELHPGLEGVGR